MGALLPIFKLQRVVHKGPWSAVCLLEHKCGYPRDAPSPGHPGEGMVASIFHAQTQPPCPTT